MTLDYLASSWLVKGHCPCSVNHCCCYAWRSHERVYFSCSPSPPSTVEMQFSSAFDEAVCKAVNGRIAWNRKVPAVWKCVYFLVSIALVMPVFDAATLLRVSRLLVPLQAGDLRCVRCTSTLSSPTHELTTIPPTFGQFSTINIQNN